jgi:RHS repeat-associated protein
LSKDQLGFANQADNDPWSVEVKAVFPDGETVTKVVELTDQQIQAVPLSGTLAGSFSDTVKTKGKKTIAHDESQMVFTTGTVATDTTITVTPLDDEHLPALDVGMTNVTKGPRRGYRFLPHGAKFLKNVDLALPYDKALIPPGHSEDDVKTFYFDDTTGRWIELERVSVDKSTKVVNSLTDHFTDMINATVTVPDHPQTVSFNPTSMKDIKAADPGAGINLIEVPQPNNMGDARLSYPIEVPPGRAGIQPQLAVQYNSAGGNGWMGLGWDLTPQSITIDTRWGVPRYDAGFETETYLLNGEQLTPVAHRGELKPRSDGTTVINGEVVKLFHTRVEGQFRRIIRHGTSPSTYWWEVIDKSGTRSFFGGSPASGVDPTAVLSRPPDDPAGPPVGPIFKWNLHEMVDTSGNTMRYHCTVVEVRPPDQEPWRQIYLERITYTGSGGLDNGPYEVTFIRGGGRPDVVVDARPGFKTVLDQRLNRIDVRLTPEANSLIRRYVFVYDTNPYGDARPGTAFNKSLLTAIVQFGEDGVTEFNRHSFSYFDEARDAAGAYRGFAPTGDWSVGADNISAGLLGRGTVSALGGSRSTSRGGHFYVGVGPAGDTSSKRITAGAKVGSSRSRSETLLAMADMDGDGLPDKVFRGSGGTFYRPNLSGPNGTSSFGLPVSLPTLPAISRETVTSTTAGGEVFIGVTVLGDTNRSTSQADVYFTDVNGDGLTDLVSGGQVLFGFLNAAGVPTFSANSADSPVPVGGGAVNTENLLEDAAAIEAERAANFPLLDTVRRWVAPYDGFVTISAPVQLIQDTSPERAEYDGADGVRVAIQLEGSELWVKTIAADDHTVYTPDTVASVPVQRGNRLYFRVQSVFDGAFDQVAWDPEITYTGTGVDTTRTDVNSLPEFLYRASQDFTLFGRRATVTAPLTGTLHLDGTFEKTGVTTDDVALVITQNGQEVARHPIGFAETATVSLARDLLVTQLDVLEWRILVDSPIDASKVTLSPTAHYTAAEGVESVTDEEGNFILTVDPPIDMELYPVNSLTAPQGFHTVPLTPPAPLPPLPVQARLQLSGLASGEVAEAVFTVKRRGALLAKRPIRATGTDSDEPDEVIVTAEVAVAPGDQLFFDVTSRDPFFASKLALLEVRVGSDSDNDGLLDTLVPSVLHTPAVEGLFPQPYRGWAAFGYNGNPPRDALPIDQSLLVINDSFDANNARVYPFAPRPTEFLWGGVDEFAWVKAASASSSRLGLDDIRAPRSEQFAGASAVPRISRSINNSVSALGIGASEGDSDSQLEFQDLNGDRFPDVISSNAGVQYSRAVGGLEAGRRGSGLGSARKSHNVTLNAGINSEGAIAKAVASARGIVAPTGGRPAETSTQGSDMPSLGFGGDIGTGDSDTLHDLIDINGDGLPDKVFEGGSVQLNLGYRFGLAEPWGGGIVNNGETLNAGVNLGFNLNAYSIAGGLNLGIGTTRSDETFTDVNGDGLPDKIVAGSPFTVRLNTGSGFAAPISWPGGQANVAVDKNISLGGGAYFTFGFTIPIPPLKFVFNPGVNFSTSMGRPEVSFRDVDGDGFTDHLFSERDSQLRVALNPIGRTNLLKSVSRPLGASMEVAYTRDGNTFDLPQSRWTLTKLTVNDGHVGEGADTQVKTFQYSNPKYNRLEREFYGYGSVVENHLDTQNLNALFRTITREYLTDSYYTKGLMRDEIVQDALGRPFTESENTYLVRDEATGQPLANLQSTTATGFPELTRTDRRFFEGQVSPGKTTFTTHEYDEFGNIIRFTDAGDLGAADDIDATIGYSTNCAATSYVIKPNRITVLGNGVEQRRREADIDCATGNVTQVRQFLADLSKAVTDLTYLANGNIHTVTGPTNKALQRYQLTYEYDVVVATHVTRISDSFGLSSQATYNFKFAKVETTTDTNNNQTTNFHDAFGRIDKIIGPYEQGQAVATLDFEYKPDAAVPHAITRHVDKDAAGAFKPSGTIDTILFTDGLKRVIQTKKDASVLLPGKTLPDDVMIVSGQVSFDAFGRSVAQKYPTTEAKGSDVQNGVFNAIADPVAPTTMEYDVLDRNTKTTIPDGTFTTISYGFGADRNNATQFETVVRDANVNGGLTGAVKHSFRDVRELITSVKEFNNALPVWTSYDYDALKQITKVTDDKGNVTNIAYDHFGRRTSIDNPDVGRTDTVYDLASNVIKKITANLRTSAQAIEYDYDFNRLSAIRYPLNVGNNITYTYGAPGALNNTAGRITRITSQMGIEERLYGKLGETVFEKKTVTTFTSPLSPEVYETRFFFDTFGRLLRLTYPDGEVVTNVYDSGGNLQSTAGVKAQAASGANHRYTYLRSLFYDQFEQRALVEQGNGVRTAYTYDAQTRRLNNLTAQKNTGDQFQNLLYTYDKVGNVKELANQVAVPPPNQFGGPTSQRFVYDDLYRLTHAEGSFQFSPSKTHTYTMDMGYDSIHNIQRKTQLHTIVQPSAQAITQKKTTYDFAYQYNASGLNSIRPHAPIHIGDRTYTYDANGNQTGWTHDQNGTRRTILWDEENRIQSLFDNGHEKTYKYDDQGNRLIKRGPQGETVYVNQFYTQRPGATGTKHIYAGTTRIASKLVRQDTPNSNPAGKTPFEKDLYFYHPDHLGTSNYITDLNAKLYEHLEYFPFGEAWVEENSNTQRTPYLFTAKELDEETGLYYFGARYYDPRTSVWQSPDPILEKYLPDASKAPQFISPSLPDWDLKLDIIGGGGVFHPVNLNLYVYAQLNPVRLIDPDGRFTSPTGSLTIRNDKVGLGSFKAPRGAKKHAGVDLAAPAGTSVIAPISGSVEYLQEGGEKIIRVTGKEEGETLTTRLLHVEFSDKLVGKIKPAKEGEALEGVTVQDLSKHPRYKGADPHVHLEVYKKGTKGPQDPMPYLRNEHKTPPANIGPLD